MKIGPYEVLRKLGEGAYGKVYLARKGASSGFVTWYALKRIARSKARGADFEAYLQREAQVGGLVNHPNLVRVHEVLTLPREWVLVQDYVDGFTLRSALAEQKQQGELVPREAALELCAELLETLHYLHTLRDPEGRETGFVHRDVKPGNVMITAGHGIRVMDFGVARGDEAGEGTLAGELRGTLAFMAPEQATGGEVGPASDQFAAGLILLQMLTNASPWGDARGAAVLGRVVAGDVSDGLALVGDDVEVLPVLRRLLERSPSQRFESASEAASALRTVRAKTATPPALRPFCIAAVESLRGKEAEDSDDQPSWTGSFRWTSAVQGMPSSAEVNSLGPSGFSSETGQSEPSLVPETGGAGEGHAGLAVGGPSTDEAAASRDSVGEDVEDRRSDWAPAGSPLEGRGLGEAIDAHETLPLQATPAQRAALLAVLSESRFEADAIRIGTGETLAEAEARMGDLDPLKTLPIADGAARASGGASAPPTGTGAIALGRAVETLKSPDYGEPARAGAHPGPQSGRQALPSIAPGIQGKAAQPENERRLSHVRRPAVANVGSELWAQFVSSPLLGTLLLLCALLILAGTTRLVWVAVNATNSEEDGTEINDDELLLSSAGSAVKSPPAASAQPRTETLVRASLPDHMSSLAGEEPLDAGGGRGEPPTGARVASSSESTSAAPSLVEGDVRAHPTAAKTTLAAEPAPTGLVSHDGSAGKNDLDADLANWRGESQENTSPPPGEPKEGQIISGSGAGERLLSEADGARAVSTRRDDGATPEEVVEPASPVGPSLRFLSGIEQPTSVPLSLRVRSDGFYATSVSAYYQWRSEGSAARKRRSLRQQSDGSFGLEIPVSELRSDRLQLWFTAEPGAVTLGDAGSPLEVKVR